MILCEDHTPASVACTHVSCWQSKSLKEGGHFQKEKEKKLDLKNPDNSMSNLKLFPIVIV